MQQETSINRNKKAGKGKPVSKKRVKSKGKKQSPTRTKGMMLNNPYQNVPVKSNSPGPDKNGFTFPGGVF